MLVPISAVFLLSLVAAQLGFALGSPSYAITGVSIDQASNGVPVRRSINDLQSEGGAQWYAFKYVVASTLRPNISQGPIHSITPRDATG